MKANKIRAEKMKRSGRLAVNPDRKSLNSLCKKCGYKQPIYETKIVK
ncbi:MAG: hypothetical protein ACLSIM_01020 [Monoglobus pectinilyticus]